MSDQTVHETAQAYNEVADAYERGRPEYTLDSVKALVHALKITPSSHVLEVGAGTGKFTKHLIGHSSFVTALEPVAAMREKLQRVIPTTSISDGSAESIPFPDQSFDSVIVANAFHWFDAPKALREMHRILKKGGGLGLIWLNDGVFSSEWGKILDELLTPYEDRSPQRSNTSIQEAFRQSGLYSNLEDLQLVHSRETTPDLIIDRISSLSFIAALPKPENQRFLESVKKLLATHPLTTNRTRLNIECTTDLYWCFRT